MKKEIICVWEKEKEEFDRFFLTMFQKRKLLFSLLNEWNGVQRSYDFKGVIPNMDQVDRRNNEQGRITKLLDANCAGRLSLHLLTNQRLLSICICITTRITWVAWLMIVEKRQNNDLRSLLIFTCCYTMRIHWISIKNCHLS